GRLASHGVTRTGSRGIPTSAEARRYGADRGGEPLQPSLLSAHDTRAQAPALHAATLSHSRARSISWGALRRLRSALRAWAEESATSPECTRRGSRASAALPSILVLQLRGRVTFAIASNGFAEGPAQALRDYLVSRGARVVTIFHPLTPEQGRRHVI